jgi:serine protease DegS
MKLIAFLRLLLPWAVIGLSVAAMIAVLAPDQLSRPTQSSDQMPRTAQTLGVSFAQAVDIAAPAVVNIHTARFVANRPSPLLNDPIFKRFFGDTLPAPAERIQTSLGSGVILDGRGYVLTNNHVVAGADEIQVLLQDGRGSRATIVGVDVESDLAVLRIGLPNLPVAQLKPEAQLRVGDIVLAIGNPYGVGQTVTMGIISATGRSRLGLNTFEDFIQTDAAINPGNSGGALVDARGQLIGINTAIFSRTGGSQGIGFAIPASLAAKVMAQIVDQGFVSRGWLGVEVQSVPLPLAVELALPGRKGVLIAALLPDGPAANAGLKAGDVITQVNDVVVADPHTAVNAIAHIKPGNTVNLAVWRAGESLEMQATVGQRPSPSNTNR